MRVAKGANESIAPGIICQSYYEYINWLAFDRIWKEFFKQLILQTRAQILVNFLDYYLKIFLDLPKRSSPRCNNLKQF